MEYLVSEVEEDGGDEVIGGYSCHVLLRRLARLPALPDWAAPREGARLRRLRRGARLLSMSLGDRYVVMYEVFGDYDFMVFEFNVCIFVF